METNLIVCGTIFLGFILLSITRTTSKISKEFQLKRYTRITLGMSENQMLQIMGGNYNCSLLSGNKKKFEWRINASSRGYSGYREYSGVSKVAIYTKNDSVIEVKPYNVK